MKQEASKEAPKSIPVVAAKSNEGENWKAPKKTEVEMGELKRTPKKQLPVQQELPAAVPKKEAPIVPLHRDVPVVTPKQDVPKPEEPKREAAMAALKKDEASEASPKRDNGKEMQVAPTLVAAPTAAVTTVPKSPVLMNDTVGCKCVIQ